MSNNNKVCIYWKRGACNRGNHCRYRHPNNKNNNNNNNRNRNSNSFGLFDDNNNQNNSNSSFGAFGSFGSFGDNNMSNNNSSSWFNNNGNNSNNNSSWGSSFNSPNNNNQTINRNATNEEKTEYANRLQQIYQRCNQSKLGSIVQLINKYGNSLLQLHATYIKVCQKYGAPTQKIFVSNQQQNSKDQLWSNNT